jgi:hypothetical protein
MRIQLVLEISDYNEHLAVEAALNIRDTPNVLYPNHWDGGYINLPVESVTLMADGMAIELPEREPKQAEEQDETVK